MFLGLVSHLTQREITIVSLFPARILQNDLSFPPLFWFTGATFTDWFTSYVNSVVSGGFPIIRDQIFRYFTWGFLGWNDCNKQKSSVTDHKMKFPRKVNNRTSYHYKSILFSF